MVVWDLWHKVTTLVLRPRSWVVIDHTPQATIHYIIYYVHN